jgi:hypothetical protein
MVAARWRASHTTYAGALCCVREDLDLALPPIEIDLGSLEHPLVAEARRVAPAAPRGQKRILSIEHRNRVRRLNRRSPGVSRCPSARFASRF